MPKTVRPGRSPQYQDVAVTAPLKPPANVVPFVATSAEHEPILTIEEIAQRLKIKPKTVYSLTRSRSKHPLPALRVGKILRFRWSMVEKWLDESVAV